MRRRLGLLCAALLATSGAGSAPIAPLAARQAPAVKRPNVIVILVDDLGWPDVSVYGRTSVPTPNLQRLARDGVAYTNGYVAASVCAVSRAALLTGRMPQRFGFQYNLDDDRNLAEGLPLDQPTLADRLKRVGYRTAAIGKWHQGYEPAYYPMRRGFDSFYGFLAGETLYADPGTPGIVTTATKRDKTYERKPGWNTVTGADARPVDNHKRYLTDDLTDQAVATIDRSAGPQPFFLYLAYNAPHWPLQTPQDWYDRFATIKDPVRRTYVAMIANMDAGVGRVLDALERKGIRDDTMIVFLSDNGCPIQFGFCDCSHPLGAGKFSYVEGGTRVPFIVSWPAGIRRRGKYDMPVSSLDIVPTALAAAAPGRRLPAGLDGVDLRRPSTERTLLWGQAPVWAARDGRWKLWQSDDQGVTRLFDVTHDVAESRDMSHANPAIVARLSGKISRWRDTLPLPRWPRRLVTQAKMCAKETEWVY